MFRDEIVQKKSNGKKTSYANRLSKMLNEPVRKLQSSWNNFQHQILKKKYKKFTSRVIQIEIANVITLRVSRESSMHIIEFSH